MYSKDILRNYVIFFKNTYSGDLPVYTRQTEIPSDESFIFIGIGSSNEMYDAINNKNQLLNQVVYVDVRIYMNEDPYTPELEEVESVLYSKNKISCYDFSSKPYVSTNREIEIQRTSPPLSSIDGDFEKNTYIINIANHTGD